MSGYTGQAVRELFPELIRRESKSGDARENVTCVRDLLLESELGYESRGSLKRS